MLAKTELRFFGTALGLFNRVDISRLSTFSIWFQMILYSHLFSENRLTKSCEYFLYSSKDEQTHFTPNA